MLITPLIGGSILTIVEGVGDYALKRFAIGGANWLYPIGVGIYVLLANILVHLFKTLGFAITNAYWDATSNLFTMAIGYLVFRESYTPLQWLGMFIVTVGIILLNGNH